MSRVLVTGASGFVGGPLAQKLIADGEEVHALSRHPPGELDKNGVHWHRADILDPASVARVLTAIRAERLVHLAWYVSHGSFWSALENVEWVEASLRLLRAFADAGGRRAILVGSCAEYAWDLPQDLDEANSPLAPHGLYGACKDGLRRIACAYAGEVGLELGWSRLFFLYGPGEQPERLVPAVVRSLLAGARVATSSGAQVRDFMYVQDAAAALVAFLQSDVVGAVNIASGEGRPVAEVLDIIGALTNSGHLIDRGARSTSASESPRVVANVELLARGVGFEPAISLKDGLAATIDWWREREST